LLNFLQSICASAFFLAFLHVSRRDASDILGIIVAHEIFQKSGAEMKSVL